jgi:hypothetical protein
MKMYMTLMTAYGVTAGIDFKFGGTVGNTMDAHRVIQHFQEEKGPEVADKIILCKTKLSSRARVGGRACAMHNSFCLQLYTRNISNKRNILRRMRRY